jgi:hypothetical protein
MSLSRKSAIGLQSMLLKSNTLLWHMKYDLKVTRLGYTLLAGSHSSHLYPPKVSESGGSLGCVGGRAGPKVPIFFSKLFQTFLLFTSHQSFLLLFK